MTYRLTLVPTPDVACASSTTEDMADARGPLDPEGSDGDKAVMLSRTMEVSWKRLLSWSKRAVLHIETRTARDGGCFSRD